MNTCADNVPIIVKVINDRFKIQWYQLTEIAIDSASNNAGKYQGYAATASLHSVRTLGCGTKDYGGSICEMRIVKKLHE